VAAPPTSDDVLPLEPGSAGEAVRDLQRRLVATGGDVPAAEQGRFGRRTEEAVRHFQERRGLLVTGRCDHATWSALVEAGWQLGDRLLYLRSPMVRGDDVADLQRKLGALGFDAGRVDGIFGPDTERAVKDFQRNSGLTSDGVCGRDVLATLQRLGTRTDQTELVVGVREREVLRRAPRALAGRRIAVGDAGGLGAVVNAVARALHDVGATAVVLTHPDPSHQALAANDAAVTAFLGLALAEAGPCRIAYYATEGFVSTGGRRLAEEVVKALTALPLACHPGQGMRLPVLRETRMPAVMCYLGPAGEVVRRGAEVADALAVATEAWSADPVEP
jgi:N-acetylmuramoyl-L-alanine amidase